MIFIYKTKTGEVILSERPYGQVRREGWEMLECIKSRDVAELRVKKYQQKPAKRDRKKRKKYKQRVRKTARHFVDRKSKKSPTHSNPRKHDPWKLRKSRLKDSLSRRRAWEIKECTYWVIRPDGKCVRVWLPEGKEHAILPPGWRFGRHLLWKWGTYDGRK